MEKFEVGSHQNSSTLIKKNSQKLSSPQKEWYKMGDSEVVIIHINQANRTLHCIYKMQTHMLNL